MHGNKPSLLVGLIMPISSIDGVPADHWLEVKSIFIEAVQSTSQYKCEVKLVSEADDVGVIHKKIVQNIYQSDIVICDVSCKNPNVMFELGMRLAFDKPTVIVKDDHTNYSFDTGIIEHIEYPRDLRFSKIVEFKRQLARKVVGTYESFLKEPDHSTFLKNFGEFKVTTLKETTVTPENLILEMLSEIHSDVAIIKRERHRGGARAPGINTSRVYIYEQCKKALPAYLEAFDFTLKDLDNTVTSDLVEFTLGFIEPSAGEVPFSLVLELMERVIGESQSDI